MTIYSIILAIMGNIGILLVTASGILLPIVLYHFIYKIIKEHFENLDKEEKDVWQVWINDDYTIKEIERGILEDCYDYESINLDNVKTNHRYYLTPIDFVDLMLVIDKLQEDYKYKLNERQMEQKYIKDQKISKSLIDFEREKMKKGSDHHNHIWSSLRLREWWIHEPKIEGLYRECEICGKKICADNIIFKCINVGYSEKCKNCNKFDDKCSAYISIYNSKIKETIIEHQIPI